MKDVEVSRLVQDLAASLTATNQTLLSVADALRALSSSQSLLADRVRTLEARVNERVVA